MNNVFFQPVSGFDLPRFAGLPTFMRLPFVSLENRKISEVEIGLIGVPWDSGTTNRPGPRHGPRQLRDLSTMIRAQHGVTGVRPFELFNCADLGDVSPNPASIEDSLERVSDFYKKVSDLNILPLTGGGDHLCSLPILRGIFEGEPFGMVHFDSIQIYFIAILMVKCLRMGHHFDGPLRKGCLIQSELFRLVSEEQPTTVKTGILLTQWVSG